MQLTATRLRGVYAMLLQWPPFNRWKLPSAKAMVFEVATGTLEAWADYGETDGGKHRIRFNRDKHWRMENIVRTMAHEMCHIRQELIGKGTLENNGHNLAFEKIEKVVCSYMGFDPELF